MTCVGIRATNMSDVHEEAKHATPSGLVNQHLISTIQARKIIPSPETVCFADISARPVSRADSSQFNWGNPRTCSNLHVGCAYPHKMTSTCVRCASFCGLHRQSIDALMQCQS